MKMDCGLVFFKEIMVTDRIFTNWEYVAINFDLHGNNNKWQHIVGYD